MKRVSAACEAREWTGGVGVDVDRREFHRRAFLSVSAAGVTLTALGGDLSANQKEQGMKVGVLTQTGGAHLSLYFQSLRKIEEVTAVVLADPDGANEAEAREILGEKLTKVYRSHEELLKQEQPRMALVSMEAKWGPGTIRLALEAGCHVLAEKPACLRWEDFEPLVKLAEEKRLHLMLALANRLNPEVLEAKRLIEAGEIGKIYGVEMHLIQDQTRLKNPEYQKSWFADRKRAGGGTSDVAGDSLAGFVDVPDWERDRRDEGIFHEYRGREDQRRGLGGGGVEVRERIVGDDDLGVLPGDGVSIAFADLGVEGLAVD